MKIKNYIIAFFLLLLINSAAAEKTETRINIGTDYRVELVSIIFILSGIYSNYYQTVQNPYYQEAVKYFKPFQNHPAVINHRGILSETSKPFRIIYSVSSDSNLSENGEYLNSMDLFEARFLKDFIVDLRDFIRVSKFDRFYERHISFYKKMTMNYTKMLDVENSISNIENFFGTNVNQYNIILSAIMPMYSFQMSPTAYDYKTINIIINFNRMSADPSNFYHEISHYYFNAVFFHDKYNRKTQLITMSSIFSKIPYNIMKVSQYYFQSPYKEYFSWAFTLLMAPHWNEKKADPFMINIDIYTGFIYIKDFYQFLDYYDKNRLKYPTFFDYYPVVLKKLEKMNQEKAYETRYREYQALEKRYDDNIKGAEKMREQNKPLFNGIKGLLVLDLSSNGVAYQNGLREGDIILYYNNKPIKTSGDLKKAKNLISSDQKPVEIVLSGLEKKEKQR